MPGKGKSLVAALVAITLTSGAQVADATPSIGWHPCPEDNTAECGTIRLPVDWTRPGGAAFDLWVARRKATGQRIGVLMTNPGGPGDSGVDFALRANTYFSPDVLAKFDVIGFDPRGVKRTQPITCSPDVLARQPSAYPGNQAEFNQVAKYNQELRTDCRQHTGPLYDHLDTLSTVRDMDAIRRALGERQISYFGHSYGSVIGEQYAELFGSQLRAMVTTGNVDHSVDGTQFFVAAAAAAEDSFDEFLKWCDGNPACPPDVATLWDDALEKVDRDTQAQLAFQAVNMLKGPQWPQLAQWIRTLLATHGSVPPQYTAIFCQDWQIRVRDYPELARLSAAEIKAAPHMRGSPEHFVAVGCIGWPQANNPQHRLRITDAPTILIGHSQHDPVSSYSWAVNIHQQARKSVLLTYDGRGHQVYTRNACTRGAIDTYLTALQASETVCSP
jgi:pimeloyl-ACP methyl ester carboxylesterase